MEEMINYAVQNGFAIVVAIYLLYERSKFNVRIAKYLAQSVLLMDRIERRLDK